MALKDLFTLGRQGQAVNSANGEFVVVGNQNEIVVRNNKNQIVSTTELQGARPYGNYQVAAISNDAKKAYITTWNGYLTTSGAGGIFEVDIRSGITKRLDVDKNNSTFTYQGWSVDARDIDLSGDNNYLIFSIRDTADSKTWGNQETKIYRKNLLNDEIIRIDGTSRGGYSSNPRTNSNGTKILFTSDLKLTTDNINANAMYLAGLDDGNTILINKKKDGTIFLSDYGWHADLSADGNILVFQTGEAIDKSDTNGISDVYMKNIATSAITRISLNSNGGIYPFISPDAKYIAYQVYNNSNRYLKLYDTKSGSTIDLPEISPKNQGNFNSESIISLGDNGGVFWSWKDYAATDNNNDADYYFYGLSTPTPTYTLTPSATSINEGSTLTTSIATTDVASGTTLYYSLSGTGINSSDFSSGALTGTGTVASNGSFSFSHTLANDLTTEGTETLNIKLYSDSSRSTQVGSTASVSIADTSVPALSKTPWLTHSGQSTNDSSAGIALFSNSDIATAQSVTKTNGASSVIVQRLTSAGLVVWSLDIGADFAPNAGSILVSSDDKVYVVGGTKLDADGESGRNDSDVFAAAISSTGSNLWYKNYRTGIHEIGSSAVIDKNGYILMDGRVSEVNDVYTMIKDVPNFYGADFSGGWRGFQLRINPSDGSISKAYTTGSFNSGSGPVAIDRSRNIAYVPGYTFGSVNGVNTVGNGDTNGANTYLIARDETTGAVLWTRMENWIRSNLVIQESEDAIYFVDKGILEKVKGSTGVTQWAKPIGNTHYTLSPIKGGGILLSEANSTGTLTIKRYDQNGTETGSQLINHTGNLQPNKFIENGDGILIVSGTTTGAITIPSDAAIRTPKQAGSDAFILSINSQFSTPVISPSYAISPSAATINEGGTLTSTVKTSNVASGTTLYYSLSGSGINSDDFSSGAITGSGKVETPQGSFSFTHIIKNDLAIEGPEYLQIKLFSDSDRKQEVANAAVTINDVPSGSTYSIKSYLPSTTIGTGQTTQSKTSFDEGERIYSVVSTTNVPVGLTLYYSISGIGLDSVDFTSGALSGSAKVGTLGTFSLSHTLKKDAKTEGLEILQIKLFSDNARTNQVGLTHTLEINDTSIETPKVIFNGTKNKDTLVGNSANNIFKGLGSADILTGMGGADTFKYALSDSRLTGFDHITDFAIGTDIIDGPSTVSSLNLKELGTVSSLTQVDISAVLTSTNFIRSGAATFSLGGGSSSRTFLALNDSRAGFQSTYDAIIEITGFSGRLTDLAIK